jgi:hypothetical protein
MHHDEVTRDYDTPASRIQEIDFVQLGDGSLVEMIEIPTIRWLRAWPLAIDRRMDPARESAQIIWSPDMLP